MGLKTDSDYKHKLTNVVACKSTQCQLLVVETRRKTQTQNTLS